MEGLQPNEFKYSLSVRGVETYELPNAPRGWDETFIKWGRSSDYFGLIRSFSLPMEFVLDGAWLLRKELYKYGIQAKVSLIVEKLNPKTWGYELLATGEIDFSKFNDTRDVFTVNIVEGGISSAVKAYDKVKYEIELDVPEALTVRLNPIILNETASLIIYPVLDDYKADYFPELSIINNEIKSTQSSVQDVNALQQSDPNWATSGEWFFNAQSSGNITIKGYLDAVVYQSAFTLKEFKAYLIKNDGTIIQTLIDFSPPEPFVNYPLNVPFDFTININTGEKLFFYLEIVGGTTGASGFHVNSGEINLQYQTQSPSSTCKALRPKYVFDKLIEKMNNVAFPTQSFLLSNDWPDLLITCGDAVRGLPNSKIKTSFQDFFNSMNAVLNVGFGVENGKAVLERKDYFFRPTLQSVDVGTVKEFSQEFYEPFIYNQVKIGYDNQDYDELNGRDEVHSTQEYSLPITRIQKELNLISPYRADPYGIEFMRINLSQKQTSDSSSDNDVFMIKVRPESNGEGEFEPETNDKYISITGVGAGNSYYNLDITPKQNLLRHGYFIHSILAQMDAYGINFESGEKNTELVTVSTAGKRVSEKSNIDVASLDPAIFLPYLATITVKLPENVLSLIDNTPAGFIKFTYNDEQFTGYIIDASTDVSKNSEREFKLLLTPLNNLLNFIQ